MQTPTHRVGQAAKEGGGGRGRAQGKGHPSASPKGCVISSGEAEARKGRGRERGVKGVRGFECTASPDFVQVLRDIKGAEEGRGGHACSRRGVPADATGEDKGSRTKAARAPQDSSQVTVRAQRFR
jgi:hypothetical protein